MTRRTTDFQTIRSEGGLLPSDLLRRVIDPKAKLEGTRPEDYGLPQGERLNELIIQSWNRLRKHWAEFRATAVSLPEGEAGTGLTNDKWSLPLLRELGFGLLPTSVGPEIGGRSYAISRFFGPVPIHLVGCGLSLDRRAAGQRGAAAANPHGLVQEFLNRSSGHLWAIVSNGLRLRVLRDNQALSRQSFLDFDLEAMFAGEVYSDFVLLWLTVHATRFAPREGERAETCWLEQWTQLAEEQGTRALGDLRGGVERALQTLGEGFTSHPKNAVLRDSLRTGQVPLADFHGQLLRVVYRLIFLFVAEDRSLDGQALIHPRDTVASARMHFAEFYGTARLREMAARIKGSRHGDLWRQFQILVGALSGDEVFAVARENLALPALGSFLWNPDSTATLNDAELTNYDFLEAFRNLAFTRQGKILRPVAFRHLGAEELGGIYESLLALTPQISADGAQFTFAEFAGNERKTSGSYYTPDSLVQSLLDSALDPVVEVAIKGKTAAEAELAILALKVCDPAVGSGHFLVGAAHRLARHLARVRALAQSESEPSPVLYQHALRDVIGRCLYGVDINPMAAELCRVSLWLEALEPGKPLSFLDHHIRVGNSLLGTRPDLISAGLPDETFIAVEGDDKKVCTALTKRNRKERDGQLDMLHLMVAEPEAEYNTIAAQTRGIDEAPGDTIEEIEGKAEQFRRLALSLAYQHAQQVADTWCAAFVWNRQARPPLAPVTTDDIRRLQADSTALSLAQRDEVELLARKYSFFHWYLAFPEVFAKRGFDCVLGNPPWEQLEQQGGTIFNQVTAGSQRFIEHSGKFPTTGTGRKNLYGLFAELASKELSGVGSVGFVLPTGVLQDQPASSLAEELSRTCRIASAFDFENRRKGLEGEKWFRDAHPQQRFCLITLRRNSLQAKFVFDVGELAELNDAGRFYFQSFTDIQRFCDSGFKVPMFRHAIDARIATEAHRRGAMLGVLMRGETPRLKSWLMFNAEPETNRQKRSFSAEVGQDELTRVYEGAYLHQFDHRFSTFEAGVVRYLSAGEKSDPARVVRTASYLPTSVVDVRLQTLCGFIPKWLLVLRRQARATDSLIAISALIPCVATEGNLTGFSFLDSNPRAAAMLCANFNSFAFNFLTRLRQAGANLNKNVYSQLPVISETASLFQQQATDWVAPRVLELTYTGWDMQPFAQHSDWSGPPFRWDEDRRFLLRCELDAAFFHLYLSTEANGDWRPAEREMVEDLALVNADFPTMRNAVAYIMDTFPIIRRKDEEKYGGDYRTKRVILEIYDAMHESICTGQPYQTRLDPPPADPSCCHLPRQQEVGNG